MLFFLTLASFHFVRAQTSSDASASPASAATNLTFSGAGVSETAPFIIGNRWEVQWSGGSASLTVEQGDGTIVAGAAAKYSGSLFMANGGTYKLHINPSMGSGAAWHIRVITLGPAGGSAEASASVYVPPDMTAIPPRALITETTMAGGTVTRGVDSASGTSEGAATTNTMLVPVAPVSSPVLVPAPTAGPVKLTEAQARAVVVIKGDNSEGTGFLVKTAAGPMVITNQHVLDDNPHVQITTSDGQQVQYSGLQGASDRDLAMLPIKDNNYSYLELAADVGNTVQVGDVVVTPGNSQGGEVLLNTSGHVQALGPQRLEISNPVYHGNSGGPIFHVKSGKVIGVVTEAIQVDTENALDKASFGNQNSAITGTMRYFGLRLDTVPRWDNYTWARFQNESIFLNQFHELSKCLDSYLNTGIHDTSEWGTYYLKNEKIKTANEQVGEMANGGDSSQRMEAARNLVFSLDAVADTDMDQIQQPGNFYAYDQKRARDEISYRQALKREIDNMGNDVSRLSNLARRNN